MLYALANGTMSLPSPGATARCPLCRSSVLSKCGRIVEWHWAHEAGATDCDPWSEPETPWHKWWKLRVPPTQCEVTVAGHRADILLPQRGVVELQQSSLSSEEIRARESHYGQMIWLLDARLYGSDRLERSGEGEWSWSRPRKSFLVGEKALCFDLGESVLVATKRADGWNGLRLRGYKLERQQFLTKLGMLPSESTDTVSYLATWIPHQKARPELPSAAQASRQPGLRRREFRDLESLRTWADRKERHFLSVYAWTGTGTVEGVPQDVHGIATRWF